MVKPENKGNMFMESIQLFFIATLYLQIWKKIVETLGLEYPEIHIYRMVQL